MDETAEKRPLADRILRASALILVAHLVFKLLGIVQYRFIGHYCDDVTRDLFSFGYEYVLGILFFIGEESIGPAFLPVFMEEKEKRSEPAAWRFARRVLAIQSLVIAAAVALVALYPGVLLRWLTFWDAAEVESIYLEQGPRYARWMAFGLFGLSLGSTTYMLLNGYKRFFCAAFGDAAVKLGLLAVLVGAVVWRGGLDGAYLPVLAGGVVLGSFCKLGVHLLGMPDKLPFLWCRREGEASVSDAAFRRFCWLVAPLLLGILFAKFRDIFNQLYILSYVPEEGLVAGNVWGRKIYQAVGSIVPYAVSIAMLPFLCEMVDRGRREELGATITRSARLIVIMCAPVAALVVALSLPLAQLLYQTGKFGYDACAQVAVANACYTVVLPFYALEFVLMQAFFANRRMVAVTAIGIGFSALSMGLTAGAILGLKWEGLWALAAVASAFTVSRILKVGCLMGYLRCFVPAFPTRETLSFAGRMFVIALLTGWSAWTLRQFMGDITDAATTGELLGRVLLQLAVCSLVGGGVCLVLLLLLLRPDILLVYRWALARLRGDEAGSE